MSAAPIIPISETAEPHAAKIPRGNFAKTRPADLGMFSKMTQSEIGVHCLIHVESIGWRKDWTRRPLKISELAEHCNQGERNIQDTVTALVDEGSIERYKSHEGYVYKRVRPIDYDGGTTWGKCKTCQATTEHALDRDVPIPHSLFLNVQRAVDRGTFLCIMLISEQTFRANKEGQLWIHPTEIKVEDFRRRTGLEKSEIEADLKKAEACGFIASSGRRGSVQTYWPVPQNWPLGGVRLKRVGGNPKPGRKKREDKVTPFPKPIEKTPKPSPVEFWCKPCGTCLKCREWGPVEIAPAPENSVKKPLSRSREGPPPPVWSDLPKFDRSALKKEA